MPNAFLDQTFKQEAWDIHFRDRPEEAQLARAFSEGFTVSSGKTHSAFSVWFLEPTQNIRERFGIGKEVLSIYSPHPRTDARFLKAIEQLSLSIDVRIRAERLMAFLIHGGSDEEYHIIASQHSDRIIVPFTITELRQPDRGSFFIRSKIANTLGKQDLFGMSSPLRQDTYFFGRNELVQSLTTRALYRREHSGLFGLRKSGKTSVLLAVQRRVDTLNSIIEYIDCENPGLQGVRWWNALENIADRLFSKLLEKGHARLTRSSHYDVSHASNSFLEDMRRIINEGINTILLLFDEIEWITPGISGSFGAHWDEDFVPFWRTIRAVSQETGNALVFIVAGVNATSVESSHFSSTSNPIFQLAPAFYLDPLTISSARTMIRTIGRYAGISFDEEVYPYLRSSFGGHPYLMRLACSEVANHLGSPDRHSSAQASLTNFTACDIAIRGRIAGPIKDILLSLVWWYPDDYELLRILATDRQFFSEYMRSEPGELRKLASYGLVTAEDEFSITYMREFLNQHGEEYAKTLSPFHRGDISPVLLPEVPDLEALKRIFVKKVDVEVKLRRLIIMYFGVKHNWDETKMAKEIAASLNSRTDRPKPQELFVGRSPKDVIQDFYTRDFLDIVSDHWVMFSSLFSGNLQRFRMNMETINKSRQIDSHSKPLTSADLEEFENSYQWILNRLERVPALV